MGSQAGPQVVAAAPVSAAGQRTIRTWFSRPDRPGQFTHGGPNPRQAKHSHQRSHRLGMIRPQQARQRRVRKQAVAILEDAVRSQQTQGAGERVGIGASCIGQHVGALRRVVEFIGDAKVGNGVQTPRQHGSARKLHDAGDGRLVRVRGGHGHGCMWRA